MVITRVKADQAGVKDDENEVVATGWTSDPEDGATLSTSGTVTITITYDGKTCEQEVTVNAKVDLTTTLTSAQIKAGSGSSSYGSCSATDSNGFEYSAYAMKNQHSNATSDYNFWQIKKYASSTAYYIQLPTFTGKIIKSITLTVSSSNKAMDGGGNSSTLYFSSSNSTSSTGDGVVSGTGASSITLDVESIGLSTGYITASGAIRIWDIEITYGN